MTIHRIDLDGLGSPSTIAAKIYELASDMPAHVPIEELCKQFDIASIEEIATEGFEAALVMDELKANGAILVAAGRRTERRRFSIAHELGHFLIPSHRPRAGCPFECSLDDLHLLDHKSRDQRKKVEAQANRFAADLLMPPARIRATIRQAGTSLESVVAMARECAVSKEAMARAWVDTHREPIAIVLAHRGQIVRQYRNEDFPWLPDRKGRRLPAESTAVTDPPSQGLFSTIEEIEPEVWLTERDAERTLVLTEQVLGQADGYALILLQAELDED